MDDLSAQLQHAIGDAYEIERELGGGGMSRLFLARELSLDRQVVIKLLPADLAHEVSLERFRREMAVIARLQHPHIVPIISTRAADGLSWYVMPYLSGESLRHRLDRDKLLPVDEGTRILREIGDALAHAHRLGIVHRDIKPANILLSDGHAVLADFGVARARERSSMETLGPLTDTGMAVGSPGYMAPEQLSGDPSVDARADIYALAVVGYEMLTGQATFAGLSGGALMAAHMRDTPKEPRKLRPEIPPAVNAALQTALAKDPAKRFQTADQFVEALTTQRRPRSRKSRKWTVGLGIAAVVVAILGLLPRSFFVSKPPPDANTIAVLPFSTLAPDLAVWREGMVEVLARNLDGWGSLRTVSSSASGVSAASTVNAASARDIGRRLGAAYIVSGSLFQSGPDSTRASVFVYDVAAGKTLAEIARVEQTSRLERLTDSLTVAIAAAIGRDDAGKRAAGFSSIGSRSLPAIKEFVQGQGLLRGAGYYESWPHFLKATTIDSGFALAYSGMAEAQGSQLDPTVGAALRLRAGRLNHGLPPRDSLLVLVDSARGALGAMAVGDRHPIASRLAVALSAMTRRFPDDPRGWYALGVVRTVFGSVPELQATTGDALDAFDRAIARDSSLLLPYRAAIRCALDLGNIPRARRYARALRDRDNEGNFTRPVAQFLWLSDSRGHDDAELRHFSDTLPTDQYRRLEAFVFIDSTATPARLFRALDAKSHGETEITSTEVAMTLFNAHGQLRIAHQFKPYSASIIWRAREDSVILAELGMLPTDSVARLFRGRLSWAWEVATPWWIGRADASSIRAAAKDFIAHQPKIDASSPLLAAWMRSFSEAAITLARHDTSAARRMFSRLPPVTLQFDAYVRQRMLAPIDYAQGRYADALSEASGSLVSESFDPVQVMQRDLFLARTADRAGDTLTATAYYRKLDALWAHADPEFAPLATEVRTALKRLSAH